MHICIILHAHTSALSKLPLPRPPPFFLAASTSSTSTSNGPIRLTIPCASACRRHDHFVGVHMLGTRRVHVLGTQVSRGKRTRETSVCVCVTSNCTTHLLYGGKYEEMCIFVCVHICIYIHICTCLYVYIQINNYEYFGKCIFDRNHPQIRGGLPFCNVDSRGSGMQHTATHCNTLHQTATHCNTLHHIAQHCNIARQADC